MFLALFFATIQYMFMLGTRTQFAILLLIVILAALQFAYSEQGIAGVLKCIGIMAVISLIAFLLYHFNVLSIRDYILSTNLAARYERRASLENADSFRFQSFWIGLRELIQYRWAAEPVRYIAITCGWMLAEFQESFHFAYCWFTP